MEEVRGLGHLFMTVFLSTLSGFMVVPAITDITMAAICPGKDECSLAIYLTGIQHAVIGMGSLVMMPMVGKLSDAYGRKTMLTIPITLSIFPLAILAYSRSRYYYYAYYVLRTLIGMLCDGSVHCLALAYVADKVGEGRRASVFGILSGVSSSAFICGSLSSHFLSTASTFQVAGIMAIVALVYMKIFLPESLPKEDILVKATETECLLEKAPKKNFQRYKRLPSFDDLVCLLRTSPAFLHVAVVSFLIHVAETGLNASLFYFLKAQFHFDKDEFADLTMIAGIAGAISQLALMPILAPAIGEERLLSVGLFFFSLHLLLHSIAWSPWVPYAAALMSVLATFGMPCLRSIASKQFGPNEQGKVQGCVTGLSSFANIVSPLAFSPLIATFLSDDAPFHFPGFSIMIAGLAAMLAFIQSLMMTTSRSTTAYNLSDSNSPRNFV
ncbi:PREDICTED: hippocampus abundant transcript 1 protein-like [Ipomoea nil]|uniref:hippocampus abundant transcript 1 protein-like n=1 Tax=Ipomoea nil TaxID=35883 RepID=UPI0009018B36|nr:PREDICTED: hippocampus abundant transcript 1 protein-like [Ipomoea nil]